MGRCPCCSLRRTSVRERGAGMGSGGGRLLLAGIVATLVIEVPMNKQVVVWQAGAMPAGWRALRNRW